ncbi:MAG TPA: GtrA family protein [Baekduia sp.]|nr:GtrA family protein [Baekduia sp.]
MTDEAASIRVPLATRVRAGLRHVHNWAQLIRFLAVGGSGYAINLVVFYLALQVVGDEDHLVAAVIAFVVALTNNFFWNRHWTFKSRAGKAHFQAARFVAVSVAAFALGNLLVLELLVSQAGMAELPAQAIAVIAATPLNFLGNKLWSFAD